MINIFLNTTLILHIICVSKTYSYYRKKPLALLFRIGWPKKKYFLCSAAQLNYLLIIRYCYSRIGCFITVMVTRLSIVLTAFFQNHDYTMCSPFSEPFFSSQVKIAVKKLSGMINCLIYRTQVVNCFI